MSDRVGRCGSCEHLGMDDNGERIQARCNKLIMPKGKGKTMGCERCMYYFGESMMRRLKALQDVSEKCNRLIAPIWCPLDQSQK